MFKKKTIKTSIITIIQFLKANSIIKRITPIKPDNGLVIIPCDPETVIGSRGDEAMISAVINNFRRRHPKEKINIVAKGEIARNYIFKAKIDNNISVIESWNLAYPFEHIYNSVIEISPREVSIIGADCVDGAYAPNLSLDLLLLYAAFQKASIPTYFTGFSYNQKPFWFINKAIKWLGLKNMPLRDDISLARFQSKTGMIGKLVADAAFMLKPSSEFEEYHYIKKWVDTQHKHGNLVLAFNSHPMLKQYGSFDEITQDAHMMTHCLYTILKQNSQLSIMLLPHDDRARVNDGTMLREIYNQLKDEFDEAKLTYLEKVPRASHLKAIAALMDGVISSRMHLAIAALGSGVPVMVADYQGKFEGLFNHFKLPHDYILPANKFCSSHLITYMNQFIFNISGLREIVSRNLPKVLELSANNFQTT